MAGEFFVMEKLYRLGHQPALTIGKAKSIDILVRTTKGNLYEVSVKAVCGGGKWPVGTDDHSLHPNRVFVFLHYRSFGEIYSNPDVFVVPAIEVEKMVAVHGSRGRGASCSLSDASWLLR
jgi:hypothetical protein